MNKHRGMTLIELAVAAALLGTLLTVSLKMLAASADLRRVTDQRQAAALAAGNLLERLAARPWNELTPELAAAEKLSPEAAGQLPYAELKIEITEQTSDENLPAKRIAVTLGWRGPGGQPVAPVKLVTWRYMRD
jgi:prepilin-type N-terminal cleavage/methylation domain-containing protein